MGDSVKQRLLQEALRRAGMDAVARQLRASPEVVMLWVRGLSTMPDRKLLPLADLIDNLGEDN